MWLSASRRRRRQRRAADRWLLGEAESPPAAELIAWRAGELTSRRCRATLVRSLRRIEHEVAGRAFPGPVPLNRRAIRMQLSLVRALERRLADHTRPVAAGGMLLADRVLTEPGSPLYSGGDDALLADELSAVLAALEPRQEPSSPPTRGRVSSEFLQSPRRDLQSPFSRRFLP